jgi:hypothetical protein
MNCVVYLIGFVLLTRSFKMVSHAVSILTRLDLVWCRSCIFPLRTIDSPAGRIDTLASLPEGGLDYLDMFAEGQRLAKMLRSEHGCHVVIALTHMRQPNDDQCGELLTECDVVLGGHDHDLCCHASAHGRLVLKSGCDFRFLTAVQVSLTRTAPTVEQNESFFPSLNAVAGINVDTSASHPTGPWCTQLAAAAPHRYHVRCVVERIPINKDLPEESTMQALVDSLCAGINKSMDQVIGYTTTALDASFAAARTKESNVGNFVADVLRGTYDVDIGFLCGMRARACVGAMCVGAVAMSEGVRCVLSWVMKCIFIRTCTTCPIFDTDCMSGRTYTHTHTHIYIYIYAYIHTCVHTYTHIHAYIHT